MARKASGADQLASARELLRTARTADELRKAQAVLLPLELGMSHLRGTQLEHCHPDFPR